MVLRNAVLVAVVIAAGVVGGVGTAEPAAASQACEFPYTATDSTGVDVTVEQQPDRLVVLGASAAQTLWDIGARDKVVGMPVQPYTEYLDGAEDRTPVMHEDGFTVNIEVVVDLEPDLVLAPNIIRQETVDQLRDAGLTVYRFEAATSLEDVYAKTRLTGELTGHCAEAEETVDWMEQRIDAVREAVADEPRPRVIYPLGGGFIAGEGTFIDAILTAAGGENIAARANVTGYQQISQEVIVEQNPDWIVRSDTLPESEIATAAFNSTTAIQEDQIVVVDGNLANQPAPRIVYPIEAIAMALHPEAFATPSPTPSPTAVGQSPTPDPVTGSSPSPTETDGQPGFGLGVAVGAVLAMILYRRR